MLPNVPHAFALYFMCNKFVHRYNAGNNSMLAYIKRQ
jgi:hypothetical protein